MGIVVNISDKGKLNIVNVGWEQIIRTKAWIVKPDKWSDVK